MSSLKDWLNLTKLLRFRKCHSVCSSIWELSLVMTLLILMPLPRKCFRWIYLWTSCSQLSLGRKCCKQAAEEIHLFPSLKLSKQEIVWKQHMKFLNWARDDSKRYAVTKVFFALKRRTDITWNITAIARKDGHRTHESELENRLYHAYNARAHASYILCSTARKST